MFRKNSIFMRIFIPVIIIMSLQTLAISFVLNANGTIDSLKSAAITNLSKNTENRGASLERMMVSYWSNIDRLEMSVVEEFGAYLKENDMALGEVWGDYQHENNILSRLTQPLIDALRICASSGVFVYFLENEGYDESIQRCNGLYIRDHDPFTNPRDSSDLLFLRGYIDIAKKHKIQLDSLWSEKFLFDPLYDDVWRSFSYPQIAAEKYPSASSIDLAFWDKPHKQTPWSKVDTNKCITYTRPVFYEGKLVAMIGTEVQTTQLERYFPADDFENNSQSGYLLIGYAADAESANARSYGVYQVTGSYIKRLIGSKEEIHMSQKNGVFSIDSGEIDEGVQIVQYPLRLYNPNAPFSDEHWALAAAGTDLILFENANNVSSGILLSTVSAFVVGIIVLVLTIRKSTEPLISIADQIKSSDLDDKVFSTNSKTYEIELLCSTLNTMRKRRSYAESQVREERQRYLIALESATDTFWEYDIEQDVFMLYYFSDGYKEELSSTTIHKFSHAVSQGEFCHKNDELNLMMFMSSDENEYIEVRIKTSVFSNAQAIDSDNDYFWFLIKASRICGDGRISRIIGTAKEITREKTEAFARDEALRRDPTTGLYNRAFGIQQVEENIAAALKSAAPFALCVICLYEFNELETFYGRVFGAFVLMKFSRTITAVFGDGVTAVRFSNDDFVIFINGAEKDEVISKTDRLYESFRSLYIGENSKLKLNIRMGSVLSSDNLRIGEHIGNAYKTAHHAAKIGKIHEFYDALPLDTQIEAADFRYKPVSIMLDVNRDNIVSSAFELFERTSDVHSAIRILINTLGELFSFIRVIICSFDSSFGASQVSYQWNKEGIAPYNSNIEKISHKASADFEAILDGNGTLLYDESANGCGEGVKKLLCLMPGETVNAYCCVMFDNVVQTGRVLFVSGDADRTWGVAEKCDLYDMVKIISANMSIEKSRSASRAKGEFLSRISHEIRTPMNAIIGMTDIAMNSIHNPGRLSDSLRKIDFSAKHLLILINDVLEMSRIESGKLEIENSPFSLNSLLVGIETLMRIPIENKKIEFNIISHIHNDHVIGDEYRLRQVLINLIGNASKFTDPGGIITFSLEELLVETGDSGEPDDISGGREFSYFRFLVKDNGIGISQEDQQFIFKPFEQAQTNSPPDKHQGTGLGLAISGNIISAMGGKIELTSELGKGSEFYFVLKLEHKGDKDTSRKTSEDAVNYTGYFDGKRMLLVDDVDINIEITSFILEGSGIYIDVAKNGQEALDMFLASDSGHYDAILMDIQMPIMDGLTATRNIRSNAERSDAQTVPIIAMTANAFDEDMKKSVDSGMNGHIAKPIESAKLLSLLKQLI